jgi:RNA-binding protein YhbY
MIVIHGPCLPRPPLKKLIDPGSRGWTRGILEKIYDVVPKHLVVKISVYGAPRGDARESESDLQNSSSTSQL